MTCELCGAAPRGRKPSPVGERLLESGELVDVGICRVCEHAFRELADALARRPVLELVQE